MRHQKSNALLTAGTSALIVVTAIAFPRASKTSAAPTSQPTTRPAVLFAGHLPDEWKSYQELHDFMLDRFVNSPGAGVERMSPDFAPRSCKLYVDGNRYTVKPVELISLNKGAEPFVYVNARDGNVYDVLKADLVNDKYKHVPISDQEKASLKRIQAGADVVPVHDPKAKVFLGAIRASAKCTECHDVKEGTLLGVFRYSLERTEEPAPMHD